MNNSPNATSRSSPKGWLWWRCMTPPSGALVGQRLLERCELFERTQIDSRLSCVTERKKTVIKPNMSLESFSPRNPLYWQDIVAKSPRSILRSKLQKYQDPSITNSSKKHAIPEDLVSALIGNKSQRGTCPLLQDLIILTTGWGPLAPREITNARLRRFIDARKAGNCPRRVRHGRYPLPTQSSETLECASREWWKAEWDELLSP